MNGGETARGRAAMRSIAAAALVLLLAACGGGGAGGNSVPDAPADGALPPLSIDEIPTGARIDVSARDYFSLQNGNSWTYARHFGSSTITSGFVTRSVTNGPDADGLITVSESDGASTSVTAYRLGAAGLEEFDPTGSQASLPAVYTALPSYFAFSTPFYPVGSTLRHIRQGSLLLDLDGDQKNDSYRLEITQVFVGFEMQAVLGQSTEVAHFTTSLRFTARSSANGRSATATATEDSYLASGLGLVRVDRSSIGPDGLPIEADYSLVLQRAFLKGVTYSDSGSFIAFGLHHRWLVYDATRRVYYASLSDDPTHPNSIATIDAGSGAITYSAPIAAGPGPLAVSSDGSTLYAGLDGTGEVARLSLPAMTEVARLSLPVDPVFGQLYAENIAVSPVSSDVFATSLIRVGFTPSHGGVALVRNMVLQPQRTQGNTGSHRIAFDASGNWLFGYNNETTEFGLRRIEVLSDGLIERVVVSTNGFPGDELSVSGGRVLVGNSIFQADAWLALLGTLTGGHNCVNLSAVGKIACQSTDSLVQLAIFDATSLAPLATPFYANAGTSSEWRLVPGPTGQVAVSEFGVFTLFTSRFLQ